MINHNRLSVLLAAGLMLLSACSNSDSTTDQNTAAEKDSTAADTSQLGETYTNATYDVRLQIPNQWILLEEPNLKAAMGTFAINLFKRGTGAEKEVPLQVHAKARHSYVAIWPHGYGTELPASQYARLDTLKNAPDFQFEVDYKKSKALILKNGTAWAYNIVPKNPPSKWSTHGFIFAQIRSTNNSATCYDKQTGEELSMKKCDFLQGDRYVRKADINTADARTIHHVLESISLDSVKNKAKATDLIEIEKPLPNMDVTSPLTIKGKARGQWYFEGNFSIELRDANGNTLVEKAVQAQGKWMTDRFVPFKTTIKFEAPDDERGLLIFHRANPSGLEKNAMKYTQPVIFPPK